MKGSKLIFFWRFITVTLFALVCVHIHFLSKEVFYIVGSTEKKFDASFEIDLCYETNVATGCYTTGFKLKTASEIIGEFKRCNISQWSTVESKTKNVTNVETEHLLSNGFICVKHKFAIDNEAENTTYTIRSDGDRKFTTYITYSRKYVSDGEYRTKKAFLFTRDCWEEESGVSNCTESGKELVFSVEYFSNKFLEPPFSNCVHRKSVNQSATQNDCYEACIKGKMVNFHLLTYGEDDNFTLDYANASDLRSLLDECAASCYQDDCNIIGFLVDIHSQNNPANSNQNGSFVIELDKKDIRTEAMPLFATAKILWMLATLVAVFFGLNLYGLATKSANLYGFSAGKSRKRTKKLFASDFVIIIIAISLSLVIEKVWFDFGREKAMIHPILENIADRNVSVSICFDLCKILANDGLKYANSCDDRLLYNLSITKLNEITWDVKEFKSKASMRNSARPYPIRHEEFEIPAFFRDFKKCFLLYYASDHQWPHLPMQQRSLVHINVSTEYAFFFLEDGHHFPGMYARPTSKSALHYVLLFQDRPRDGCINYQENENKWLQRKDDLIQDCVVRDRRNKGGIIPIGVNLKIEGNMSKYADFKFSNDSHVLKDSLKHCKSLYANDECVRVIARFGVNDLIEEIDNISISLTPVVYVIRPLEDDSALVVLARIIAFLVIFTGFSVRKFSEKIYSPLIGRRPQLDKPLFYLSLSFLFLIHFGFLFYQIIHHPMLVVGYDSYANEMPAFVSRLCYETGVDLEGKSYTVEQLDSETLKLDQVIENIRINGEKDEVIDLGIQNLTLQESGHGLQCCNDSLLITASEMYLDDLKCFNFYFPFNETNRLNFRSLKMNKLISITFSFREFPNHLNKRLLIHNNRAWVFAFGWNKAYPPAEYVFETAIFQNIYQDDYWYLKNFALYLKDLVGSKSINSIYLYLMDIKQAFMTEQYATTTLVPIFPSDKPEEKKLPVKNRQFNYYMQFRAMATGRNKYDFTQNTEKVTLRQIFYVQKELKDKLTMTLGLNQFKYIEKSRNRYRVVELFLHLFITIAFWFQVDIISLPVSLKSAFPILKFFTYYFLYYVVSFLVCLFEFWFAFVRFLKFKTD